MTNINHLSLHLAVYVFTAGLHTLAIYLQELSMEDPIFVVGQTEESINARVYGDAAAVNLLSPQTIIRLYINAFFELPRATHAHMRIVV